MKRFVSRKELTALVKRLQRMTRTAQDDAVDGGERKGWYQAGKAAGLMDATDEVLALARGEAPPCANSDDYYTN